MSLFRQVKEHFLIGGHSAIAGWGLLVLLIASGGISGGHLKPGVDITVLLLILVAAVLTGNGVYAINAYFDREVDKINKTNRPIPAGRMTPQHALRYSGTLMALGMLVSLGVSVMTGRYLTVLLWGVFTLLGLAYSVPPVKLKARHLLGNLCFAAFGALTFSISNVAYGWPINIPWIILLVILIMGMISMKDFHDYEGDKAMGDITFPVKVGKKPAAAISIGILTTFILLLMAVFPHYRVNPLLFLQEFWYILYFLGSLVVYIALDVVDAHLSNAYSGVQYYSVIFLVAYIFSRSPLGLTQIAWLVTWDRVIILLLYTVFSSAAVYLAWKKGRVLKPA